jgi:hypothetical protein
MLICRFIAHDSGLPFQGKGAKARKAIPAIQRFDSIASGSLKSR